MKKIKFCLIILTLTIFTLPILAQHTVTGTVTDKESGETLVGATIRVRGTTIGTVTNIDGKYSIPVSGDDVILVFSYVGYMEEEIPIGDRTVINVGLVQSLEMISELVVIGYGQVRREDLTGSVAIITSEELTRIPATTWTRALQGRAAGVMVSQTGIPGDEAQIRIRGIGSITRNPNPIYVIDGVITGRLSSVNPNDIESLTVLKDASASAIYGADGANGVILITTKRGQSGLPRVNYSGFTSVDRVPRNYDIMNASEFVDFYTTLYQEAGRPIPLAFRDDIRQFYYGDGWQQGTNWQDEVTRTGWGHNHSLRFSGGGERSNYSISTNYNNLSGTQLNRNSELFQININADFELGRHIEISPTVRLDRRNRQEPFTYQGHPWQVTLITSPLMRIHNENNKGGFEGPQIPFEFVDENGDILIVQNTAANDKPNPKGPMEMGDHRDYNTGVFAGINVDIKPTDWLTFTSIPSVEAGFFRRKYWVPAFDLGVRSAGQASLNEQFMENINLSLVNQLTFSRYFALHNITAMVGHHVRRNEGNEVSVTARGFPYEALNTISWSLEDNRLVNGYYNPFTSEAILGRINYDYAGKYLLTASIRRDGNSRFGPHNRTGVFPSFSLGWKINEDFLMNVKEISMLKLRFGYGVTGNSDIGSFQYQSVLDNFLQFSPVIGGRVVDALNVVHSMGNPAIMWEGAAMTNMGIDLNLLRNRIQLSAEYYIKSQDQLLVRYPAPMSMGRVSGTGDPWYNLGEIQNRGFDFMAGYRKMEGTFNYSVNVTLTTLNNEVISLPADVLFGNNLTTIGYPIGSFYGHVAERIITPDDFDDNGNYLHARQDVRTAPGDLKFRDINGDGVINDLDREIIGNPWPEYTYSLNFWGSYRGWDISLFFFGMQNFDIYNHQRPQIEGFVSQDLQHNKLRSFANNYYREDRPSEKYLRADMGNYNRNDRVSTWYLEDGSFFRLRDIQIGYTIPAGILQNANQANARVYLSATNLFTITSYTGRDPEAATVGNVLQPNNDGGAYPVPRGINFGIMVEF